MAREKSYHGAGYTRPYETKSGVRWRYQIRVPVDPNRPDRGTKPLTKGGFLTEKSADAAKRKAQAEASRGVRVGAKTPTVAQFAETWLNGLDLTAATMAGYRRQFVRHILPRIGTLPLDQVRPTTLAVLYQELATEATPPSSRRAVKNPAPRKPLGANSISKIHATFGSMLKAAVEDGIISANPAAVRRTAKPPTKAKRDSERPEMAVWNAEQMAAFLAWNADVMCVSAVT